MGFRAPDGIESSQFTYFTAKERVIIKTRADKIHHPYGSCGGASLRLMDDLLSQGFDASVLRCQGLRLDAPDADVRWLNLSSQTHWVHYVVKSGANVIDLTRRQFFPHSFHPFLQPYASCIDEWEMILPVA